jgi:WD40 repeat protein
VTMRRALAALTSFALASGHLAAQAPGTDVYLARLTLSKGGATGIAVARPVNITNRRGYDNQPAFMAGERAVFYTSTREDGQSDIYRYDVTTRTTTRVTATPESEYSATLIPGTNRFSVVRVEPDSTQRLWSFAMDGSDPRLVLRTIKPVGYHAWLDSSHLALFVLGRPATLQVAEVGSEHVDTVARDIGRSLSVSGPHSVSFVQRAPDSTFTLNRVEYDPASGRSEIQSGIAGLPAGAEYVVWTAQGTALTATGSKLFALRRESVSAHWALVADFAGKGIKHISRLAISPEGRWLAFVADDSR